MILRHLARTGKACPTRADGGLPRGASEEARSQDTSKGRFYTPKSFAIGSEVKKIEEQVRMVVADANMCYSFDEPERVSVRIIDIVRPIFFGICWALFIVFTPLGMPAHSLTSFTGLVFTLHMIIQSI